MNIYYKYQTMKSSAVRRILADTPDEVRREVRRNADIVVRVHELIAERGMTQLELATGMGKKPSEISKWLSGHHNFTLRSIAKLESELNETILHVPKRERYTNSVNVSCTMTVIRNDTKISYGQFIDAAPILKSPVKMIA